MTGSTSSGPSSPADRVLPITLIPTPSQGLEMPMLDRWPLFSDSPHVYCKADMNELEQVNKI